MTDSAQVFADKMEQLRKAYGERLPGQLDEIDKLWRAMSRGDSRPDLLEMLRFKVHGITGSGTTFGFPELSDAARRLGTRVAEVMEKGQAPDRGAVEQIGLLVAELRPAAGRASTARAASAVAVPAAKAHKAGRRVFLVEDDAVLASDLATQLKHFNYDVEVFDQPDAALRAWQESKPAAVIMDVMFPEGGLAGAKAALGFKDAEGAATPVIMLSARADFKARITATRSGADEYLVKPVNINHLVDRLDALTSKVKPEPYRVMIVDDDPVLAGHYSAVLEHAGMITTAVSVPERLLEVLEDFVPDLILMDLYLPDYNGMELAAVIRQQPAYVSIPIVYLSTESDRVRQHVAMSQGAEDFLTKPVQDDQLVRAAILRAERARTLREFMIRDGLTGLYSHVRIVEQIEIAIKRTARTDQGMALVLIDVDHFKKVNDAYGHRAGDRVLRTLAKMLQQRMRETDVVGRYGGEEFAVLMPGATVEQAAKVVGECRERFAAIQFHTTDGMSTFRVTFSAGIAGCPPFTKKSDLIEIADKALYQAKDAGRNRVATA